MTIGLTKNSFLRRWMMGGEITESHHRKIISGSRQYLNFCATHSFSGYVLVLCAQPLAAAVLACSLPCSAYPFHSRRGSRSRCPFRSQPLLDRSCPASQCSFATVAEQGYRSTSHFDFGSDQPQDWRCYNCYSHWPCQDRSCSQPGLVWQERFVGDTGAAPCLMD